MPVYGHNEAINWIIDNQLGKRNVPGQVKKYLIGKRYTGEKNVIGGDRGNQYTTQSKDVASGNVYHQPKTAEKIAEQNQVSEKTVRNSETFSDNVDQIAEHPDKTPMDILTNTKVTQEDIKKVAVQEPVTA